MRLIILSGGCNISAAGIILMEKNNLKFIDFLILILAPTPTPEATKPPGKFLGNHLVGFTQSLQIFHLLMSDRGTVLLLRLLCIHARNGAVSNRIILFKI